MNTAPGVANDSHVDGTAVGIETPDYALAPIGDREFAAGLSEVEVRRSGRKRVAPTLLDEVAGKAVKTKAGAKVSAWKAADKDDEDMGDVDVDSEWEEDYLMANPASVYATNLQARL